MQASSMAEQRCRQAATLQKLWTGSAWGVWNLWGTDGGFSLVAYPGLQQVIEDEYFDPFSGKLL